MTVTFDPASVGEATNVLLLDSIDDPNATEGTCGMLMADADRRVGELHVAYGGTGEDPVRGTDRESVRRGVVAVGDGDRSSAADGGPDFSGAVAVDAVADPGDLQGVGVSISAFLDQWDDLDRILLCFDSLTDLLAHAPPDVVLRFVRTLADRLESAGVVAHFHLDPTAHDESVVDTFGTVFDAVERVDPPDGASTDDEVGFEEASDEDVLETLDELDGEGLAVTESDRRPTASRRTVDEATDEDIARALEE
ncbi:MAG: hypothetical protein ACI9YT_000030 [Halobacteriales archaeon]